MRAIEAARDLDGLEELVAERLGLDFPPDRRPQLERGLRAFAGGDGIAVAERLRRLLDGPSEAELAVLANHLVVGETHFLRGGQDFAALARHVLPALIAAKRQRGEKQLRIWSAGCCTGEECYSLSIVTGEVLPDIADWQVEILGTDISSRFLDRAVAGVYGEWSFRGTPAGFRQRYFTPTPGGQHVIRPEVRRRVRFARLNLATPDLASQVDAGSGFDLIVCRNVLMYFTSRHAESVARALHGALRTDGWLVVAPCEMSSRTFAAFRTVVLDGAVFYAREDATASVHGHAGRTVQTAPRGSGDGLQLESVSSAAPPGAGMCGTPVPVAPPAAQASPFARQAAQPPAMQAALSAPQTTPAAAQAAALASQAATLADQGHLADARKRCEQWIAQDKLDPSAHYLLGAVLAGGGEHEAARAAFSRSLYLEATPIASYALASLERRLGRREVARRHLASTLALLAPLADDAPLAHADAVRCGELRALVRDALEREHADD